MPRIGDDVRQMIFFSLAGKRGEEARAIIEDLSAQLHMSVGYLYKLTDVVRANGRAIRKDAGMARLAISEDQFKVIANLTTQYDFTAEHAIRLAELNGMIPPGVVKPYRYNLWLRDNSQSRARLNSDVKPGHRFEAKGPNMLHHFDTTKLEQIHFDAETETLSWNPRLNRKNSRGQKPESVWLYSLVDDHSRAKFAYLYRSENQYNHHDFFYRAWAEKENPSEFPFYGIPEHLYMDKGPVNYALKVLHALHQLGIHLVPTTPSTSEPYGARKHGKVEVVFKDYGEWLKEFKIHDLSWEEAQESLYQYVLMLDRRMHSETRARPFERWLSIKAPRHMPAEQLYQMLKFDSAARRVNSDLTFTIDNHVYRLPERRPFVDWIADKMRKKIEVYWEPGKYEKVFAVNGSTEIELAECRDNLVRPAFSYPREQGEQTSVDLARAAAQGMDHSALKLYETDRHSRAGGNPSYLPRKGEPFDNDRIAEKSRPDGAPSFAPEVYLDDVKAIFALKERGFFSGDDMARAADRAWLKALMAGRDKIPQSELGAAIEAVKSKQWEAEG